MTNRKPHPAIILLALVPAVIIGAVIMALAYPLMAFAVWALKEDVQ